jgi:hypothetical protein
VLNLTKGEVFFLHGSAAHESSYPPYLNSPSVPPPVGRCCTNPGGTGRIKNELEEIKGTSQKVTALLEGKREEIAAKRDEEEEAEQK